MIDRKDLYGSIKLSGETVFHHNISQDKDKLDIYNKAIADGKIVEFDQTTLTRLRKLYYAYYSALIYIFYEPTTFHNIANKVELLTHTMEDKEYQIVHGDTDSTRSIPFFMYGVEHLDFNSWLEVKEGQKVWIYDLFSMLKIERETYYKLEHPEIKQIISKSTIMNHPGRERDDFKTYYNGFDYMLIGIIPEMEKNMPNHPFADILIPEITRFKKEIDFEKLVLDFSTETKRNLK